MSWFKTAVICLCIIGGFASHSYIDRYTTIDLAAKETAFTGQGYLEVVRYDKWTGRYEVASGKDRKTGGIIQNATEANAQGWITYELLPSRW